ncbi:hypothetical protein H6G76_35300 [Nostoc sp. FACHB-152]|uniref:hypothetical protein n=1 Tax=unclassified Nostoc TaxID=2593658 RepID=UPI0016821217|nr:MULTISPECIES: hypothetical protein [unclassified Nostoc]MBD2452279.1 hypothetical protein [Nostoc sp. FACHB-152]MBD2469106.1 hypothetical protein [Nostoc sp. FACHB-145]
MFHGIEKELLHGDPGLHRQQSPPDIQSSEYETRDIWELPPQESTRRERVPKQEFKLLRIFSKLKRFSLKA